RGTRRALGSRSTPCGVRRLTMSASSAMSQRSRRSASVQPPDWRTLARRAFLAAMILVVLQARGTVGRTQDEELPRPAPEARAPAGAPDSLLWIEIRNVTMHLDERATIRVKRLRGQVRSSSDGQPAILDDRNSFSIQVTSGTVGLTGDDLSTLLNSFVFAYEGAPLKKLRARPQDGQVALTGTMHKGVDLGFDITAAMSLTPDGMI